MRDYFLREETPAKEFCDAYYLGNGHLGLTAYGGAPQETLNINEDTLWSGSEMFHLNPQHYDRLMEARDAVLKGDVKKANTIINNEMEGRWFETYLPLADLHITTGQKNNRRNMPLKMVIEPQPEDISKYERLLDLGKAVSKAAWERDGIHYEREYFVSYPKDTAFVWCTAKGEGHGLLNMAFGVDSKLHAVNGTKGNEAFLKGIAPDHAEPSYTSITPSLIYKDPAESKALRFACCVRVLACNGTVFSDGARVYVNDADYVLLAVKAGTNYAGFQKEREPEAEKVLSRLREELDQLEKDWEAAGASAEARYEAFQEEHQRDYRKLYDRVDVDLGEDLSAGLPTSRRLAYGAEGVDDPSLYGLYLQYSRYLIISGSRPGSQALNLQGIWNDTVMPPWSSNYTNNINVEMNYWPAETGNLSECHLPLAELLKELSVAGRQTAEGYYHMKGWVTHHNTDLWRSSEPSCEDASWSWWPMGGAWMCEHIWTHFVYTKDEAFLREMYPVLKGACEFMLDFLTENEEGYLVTAPSLSPENKFFTGEEEDLKELVDEISKESRCSPNHPKISAVTQASTMDMSILRELFSNTIEAEKILGITEGTLGEALAEAMKRFPPYKTGKYGQLLEWYRDYEECTPGMSHTSQMYPVYPGNLFTEEKTPELMKAARKSLERRLLHARQQTGWPGAWKVSLMARFHDPLECGHLLKSTGGWLGAGLMTASYQQIDAIFGLGAGVEEMLLQSQQSFIELLPSVPVNWNTGSFKGLCARGGFEVSVFWKKGSLTGAEILSKKGGLCRVKAKGLTGVKDMEDGTFDGEILTFHTEPGKRYGLTFTTESEADREYFL